jgi:AMP-activated protein kinase-like protein
VRESLAAAVLLVIATGGVAAAQTESSVGASLGSVRYEGGLSSQAFAITPSVRHYGLRSVAGMSLALLFLADNEWSFQGGPDARVITRPVLGTARFAADGWANLTTRSYVGSSASGGLLGEVVWEGSRGGVGLGGGVAAGWLSGDQSVRDARLRARAWTHVAGAALVATLEPTRHLGGWYTDVAATAAILRQRAEGVFTAGARLASGRPTLGSAVVSVRWSLGPTTALELAGGSYLPEPLQGLPRATFASLGLRIRQGWRPERMLAPAPVRPQRLGERAVIRFRVPEARRVEIAGEWTDWTPVPMVQVEPGVWQAPVDLPEGVYHFNLVVDGQWRVPDGVASVPDRYGSRVAVLMVR